jgi:S-adenosylmethionine decarboxylase
MFVGTHAISDLYIKNVDLLKYENHDDILGLMMQACVSVNATILHSHCHSFGEDVGFTATLILAESHASIHTWPEHGLATIDFFMCGKCDSFAALDYFENKIRELHDPELISHQSKINRGWV